MTQNNAGTKKRPPPVAGFKKGRSGNPGGRPKKTAQELDLVAACKAKTPEALAVIDTIMRTGEKDSVRLTAAMAIIERGYGKPIQPSEVKMEGSLTHSHVKVPDLTPEQWMEAHGLGAAAGPAE